MYDNVEICVELVSSDVQLPKYSKPGDAGMDVRSTIDIEIGPGKTVLIRHTRLRNGTVPLLRTTNGDATS